MSEVVVKHIQKKYRKHQVLQDISFTLEPGKIYGLLGRNGVGKSTLLRIINNRAFANNGEITLDGRSVVDNEAAQRRFYLMSDTDFYPSSMKVRQAFQWLSKFYGTFDWRYNEHLVKVFDLDVNQKIAKLSTGYLTIFKLINALCLPVEFIFLDEPVLGLDANNRELFYSELLSTYEERPRTFVIATHLIEEVANIVEHVLIVDKGVIKKDCDATVLLNQAHVISGPQAAVEEFVAGYQVLQRKHLGEIEMAYVLGELPRDTRTSSVAIQQMSLQELFICLTGKVGD
ncbi:ATP-binding cassette domain-containing protein [Lapidilactobacillus bayanensis]|uniref:ATP-binding cassette domain-containing protein n=1 Tax=Lapidilactobacillus bayanensis TaxID=2485998 RepID=UPI000F78017C|nr:ABC transporter ATP-binding protein [Lapidilactobacillus bayanensis]